MLALLSVTAYGQVDHSSRWGENKGSLNSYWGIKSGFPSYGIYDQENLNFGNYDDVKSGKSLYTAISYEQYRGYVDFSNLQNYGKYIIDNVLPVLDASFGTFGSDISRYFRSPSATLAEAAVSSFYNSTSGQFYMLESPQYTLYKYRKYQYPLKDLGPYGASTISDTNIKSLIILIHGHNDSSTANPYSNNINWNSLRSALEGVISKNSKWKVIGYDWAEDADNGSVLFTGAGAMKSAGVAHYHGIHLAEALKSQFPSLQKVHFITHSAGLWVARSACVKLSGTIITQVTALDPFLPSKIDSSSPLNSAKVSDLSGMNNMYRFENYYVIDSIGSDAFYGATSGNYYIPGNINMLLGDDSMSVGQGTTFQGTYIMHSGPIQWYSDSISSLGKTTASTPFIPFKSNERDYGWSKSLFNNEPHIITFLPEQDQVVAPNSTTVISTSSKSYNNDLNLVDINDPIKSSWSIKDTSTGQWYPQSSISSEVQFHVSSVKGSYILRYTAYNNAGSDSRDINIRVRSYYEQWAEVSNGLTGSGADALADISGNGVPNLIKFALGKTPMDKSIPQYNTSTLTSNSKKYLKISVPRSGKPTGVSIIPEVSSDLQTWNSTEAQTLTDTASEYSAQDLVPMDSATRRFIRLRFTEQ